MTLTGELEATVLKTYHAYWDSYLKGDMETFASILADDCHIIGSTEFDVFDNKQAAVDFYSATANQIAGKFDFRNRKINLLAYGENVMVQELCDFYFLIEESWHFYGHTRLSTLFGKKENSWKIIHQHGSLPDTRTNEGEQVATEKISRENIDLREAVKRRTVELEYKNRELEIEAALERVRARTIAMQHSSELADTSSILFQQIKALGFEMWSCGFCIWKENDFSEAWMGADSGGLLPPMMIPYKEEPTHRKIYEASLLGAPLHEYIWEGGPLEMHYAFMRTVPSVKTAIEQLENSGLLLPAKQCYYVGFFKQGYLLLITKEPKNDAGDLTKRFSKVFEQTYTRFLDLQKAEEQMREAQLEAALERVRSKTMAMHNSKDVGDTVAAMFDELLHLGIEDKIRCGIGIIDDTMQMEVWTAYWGNKEKVGLIIGSLDMSSHQMLSGVFHSWKNKVLHTSYTLAGEDEKDYYRAVNNAESYPAKFDLENLPKQQFQNAFYFKEGFIYVFSEAQLTTDSVQIFKRFAKVFEQTYTRFLDLQKAELQTREAQIELALERIRARTMAMQHSEELADASLLLDTQVRALGIKTWGCAFNIYGDNESTEWFSSETGTMPSYKIPRENLFLRYYEEGQTGKLIYVEKYSGAACAAHYDYLCTLPGIGESLRKVKEGGGSFPFQQIDHVTYFKYGYLLFITLEPVLDAHDIFVRFAKVFEQTYTRFLDLQKAEAQTLRAELDLIEIKAARKKAEEALTELQITQKQLIQSEKMASLGELTAGIAHEIQNPLNFVNNFSEVSNELIDEMNDELSKGDIEEARAIAADIKLNLEKINHHGKRADAIVKGMLQHSQSSKGQKQLADINALCEEYFRLAYHGVRAKNKLFNATLQTDFDEAIGQINIIPQDIGRVVLNLLTNAFYAVEKQKSQLISGYEPTVVISTKKIGDHIEVSIKDNGNGIPAHVLDKIFQPFFTTKPTGQGTGLGLSLAYDIVKAHGGEIKVETMEGKGATFIMQIPA